MLKIFRLKIIFLRIYVADITNFKAMKSPIIEITLKKSFINSFSRHYLNININIINSFFLKNINDKRRFNLNYTFCLN